ncbi:MAG TPA: nuclear transport factor 2 family protein [Solirubrobacteraceae bacterium]|nr:nuclear transport factor 2 family protein [Solirubrobacteraceae bacterium]
MSLTRRILEAWNSGDMDAWSRFYAADVTFDSTLTNGVLVSGRERLRDYQAEWRTTYGEISIAAEEIVDMGNGVVFGVYRQTARPIETDGYVTQQEAMIGLIGEGLVSRLIIYPQSELAEARAAAERLAGEGSTPQAPPT